MQLSKRIKSVRKKREALPRSVLFIQRHKMKPLFLRAGNGWRLETERNFRLLICVKVELIGYYVWNSLLTRCQKIMKKAGACLMKEVEVIFTAPSSSQHNLDNLMHLVTVSKVTQWIQMDWRRLKMDPSKWHSNGDRLDLSWFFNIG